MFDALPYRVASGLWLASGAASTRRFQGALQRPGPTQERLLSNLLRANAECEYGRRHGFAQIGSVREFQERVPVVRYEDIEPEIEAIKGGRKGVLTAEPVLMLEKSGGSSGPAKYLPYTAGLKR